MFVLVQVSSMKTRLPGFSPGCFERHSVRSAATSERACSAAWRDFFYMSGSDRPVSSTLIHCSLKPDGSWTAMPVLPRLSHQGRLRSAGGSQHADWPAWAAGDRVVPTLWFVPSAAAAPELSKRRTHSHAAAEQSDQPA